MFDRHPLLPPQQTEFEAAWCHAAALRPETTPAAIRALYHPATIPAGLLPWLAYAWDAPYWPADTALRRAILAASLNWHRSAGTLAAFRQLAEWQGVEITRVVLPPARRFYGRPFARDLWLQGLALLRWYTGSDRAGQVWIIDPATETRMQLVEWDAAAVAPWPPAQRVGRRAFTGASFYGAAYLARDRSNLLAQRLAVEPDPRFTVRLPNRPQGKRAFAGRSFYGASYLARDWAGHIVSGQVGTSPSGWEWNPTCRPGLHVVELDGEHNAEAYRRPRGRRVFAGASHYGAAFLVGVDGASVGAAQQWRIVPTSNAPRGFPLLAHAGAAIGMPPYHARLYLRITRTLPDGRRNFFGAGHYGAQHFGKPDRPHRFHQIAANLRPAKACRDRVQIGLETRRPSPVCPH